MTEQNILIDSDLVHNLVVTQFPKWKNLPIKPILPGGWDNRCYQLGNEMIVRLPSAERYVDKVAKEQKWLPKLAAHLPLKIPSPLVMGNPSDQYPWHWSIYRWIPGQTVYDTKTVDKNVLAKSLAHFLLELQAIDTVGAPLSGQHNFYRGGDLSVYDSETQNAIEILKEKIDVLKANHIWKKALSSKWQHAPVWVHGDISIGNLLMENGELTAVIDFGGVCIGDPACDLVMAWTYFDKISRRLFQENMRLDSDTWDRACGWALWKALIVAAQSSNTNQVEKDQAWHTLEYYCRNNSLMNTLEKNITNLHKEKGFQWLADLPNIINLLAEKWLLTDINPVGNMSWHYVAFAKQKNQKSVVLKVGCDEKVSQDEYLALHYFDGQGAIRLLDYDTDHSALLLEQAIPGDLLISKHNDIENTINIYADTVNTLCATKRPLTNC